jgi:hypothetical protein
VFKRIETQLLYRSAATLNLTAMKVRGDQQGTPLAEGEILVNGRFIVANRKNRRCTLRRFRSASMFGKGSTTVNRNDESAVGF